MDRRGAYNLTQNALSLLQGHCQEQDLMQFPELHKAAKKKAFTLEVYETATWCQTHQEGKHAPKTLKEAVAFVKANGKRTTALRTWLVNNSQGEIGSLSPAELAKVLAKLVAKDVEEVVQQHLKPAAAEYAEAYLALEEKVIKARHAEAAAAQKAQEALAAWLKTLEKEFTQSDVVPADAKAFMDKKSKLLPDLFKRGHGKAVVAAADALKPRLLKYLPMAAQSPGSVLKMGAGPKMFDLLNQMRLQRLHLAEEILEHLEKWIDAKEKHNAEHKHQSEKLPIGKRLLAQFTADRNRWKGLAISPPEPQRPQGKGTPGVDMVNF